MTKGTNGLKEEIEVSNFFSRLGYFTRFHIQLYPRDGKISDIDVFCLKFESNLFPTRTIIETKRNCDKSTAIFQLYGLSKFYHNCNAFFVNSKISDRTFKISNKLGIKVYSFERLKKISEGNLTHNSTDLSTADGEKLISFIDIIKKQVSKPFFWRYHELWLENDPFKRLISIQELFEGTDEIYGSYSDNPAFLWFRKELFLMAFFSVLEISSRCIELDSAPKISNYISDQFFNLGISKEKKLQLKKGVDTLVSLLEKQINDKIEFKLEIVPEWGDLLADIVKKIILEPQYANEYLLINEQIFRSIIRGKPKNITHFSKNIKKEALSSINTDLLKILHKDHIFSDFNEFI